MSVRKGIRLLVWVAFAVVLAITNPTMAEYGNWLHQQAVNRSSGLLETLSVNLFLRPGEIVGSTTRQNYVVCSIYQTNLDGHRFEFLGLFQKFIPLGQQS